MKFMRILLMLLILLGTVGFKPTACLNADVVILADVSGSMAGNEYFIESSVKSFVKRFGDEPDVKIGFYTFADADSLYFHLGQKPEIDHIKAGGNTYLRFGLKAVIDEFKSKYSTPSYRKILILISDGEIGDKTYSKITLDMMRSSGIYVIGIMTDVNAKNRMPVWTFLPTELINFIKENSDAYVEASYKDLEKEMMKLNICM